MAEELAMTKVSTSNKVSTMSGPGYGQRINMYTIVQGRGSKRTSHTRHLTESGAEALRKSLGGK